MSIITKNKLVCLYFIRVQWQKSALLTMSIACKSMYIAYLNVHVTKAVSHTITHSNVFN